MFRIDELFCVCDKFAPLALSEKMVKNGEYDNSGILIKDHESVSSVLFSLDLSIATVRTAKRLKCDSIVTHHPAIYYPIKSVDCDNANLEPIRLAIANKMNVISMHLNLDVAPNGIDESLARGLGAKDVRILDMLDDKHGYGREFLVDETSLADYVKKIKKTLGTNKAFVYGENKRVRKIASFCGGGSSFAERLVSQNKTDADTIVTSDMPHHIIKFLVESGKNIILIPHYVAEKFGFNKYYADCKAEMGERISAYYFDDKRFW